MAFPPKKAVPAVDPDAAEEAAELAAAPKKPVAKKKKPATAAVQPAWKGIASQMMATKPPSK